MTSGPLFRTVRARLTLMHVATMVLVLMVYAAAHLRARPHQHLERARRAPAERLPLAAEMAQRQPDGTLVWFDSENAPSARGFRYGARRGNRCSAPRWRDASRSPVPRL